MSTINSKFEIEEYHFMTIDDVEDNKTLEIRSKLPLVRSGIV